MTALDDGTYDVLVVDAHDDGEGTVHLELAIVSGASKGDVIRLAGPRGARDPVELLGLPATLRVTDGVPRVSF